MDSDLIDTITNFANNKTQLQAAHQRAAEALGLSSAAPPLENGCAATLSSMLIACGVDVPLTLGAGHLVQRLGGNNDKSRRWQHIEVGQQQAGDVGVTYDRKMPSGADHLYLVAQRIDADKMLVADNKQSVPHPRLASGGGETPTEYFLRPSSAQGTPGVPVKESARVKVPLTATQRENILQIAAYSEVARYDWPRRGVAPIGYIKGMALAYAQVYQSWREHDDICMTMARAANGNEIKADALDWYGEQFTALGMKNGDDGADTLRHLFVLLTGLGMRESSGRYCEGRDRAAYNVDADTAEAGLFQTSYNLIGDNKMVRNLFEAYTNSTELLSTFQEGVHCRPGDMENQGVDKNGLKFQQLSKTCPAFAVELAAVGLRLNRRHWGPINRKEAALRPECDWMLLQVQHAVDQTG